MFSNLRVVLDRFVKSINHALRWWTGDFGCKPDDFPVGVV
jgi:hypothetical protein